jgi:thiamine biosynthesis protein ThiI
MATIGSVVSLPVLRPLVGMDKDEITAEAQRLGTYSISIIPDQDCCTLFTPRHPATKARVFEVERAETNLPIDEIVAQAAESAVVEHHRFPI